MLSSMTQSGKSHTITSTMSSWLQRWSLFRVRTWKLLGKHTNTRRQGSLGGRDITRSVIPTELSGVRISRFAGGKLLVTEGT